ncbi:hypothetical protein Poli38472_004147 [Pythium oligandrum]|uniref:Uncharacterized protein n=1 Tax=Pythium oligandrum TaxID=41045 RepID=A0A8K1CMP6_PYTOL|nr:hypothetical protein Poli38472_004147 [Pythium oligandrum]|eukprot:TMW66382.1 hypothetical protein Poli38472_004147 [Pythium oligandrum]
MMMIMRTLLTALAIGWSAQTTAQSASALACSSLNGPFCTGVSSDFATPFRKTLTNLDHDEAEKRRKELSKRLKVESVLKQYELEALQEDEAMHEQLLDQLDFLLDEAATLLEGLELEEDESPVVGSFAFSNQGDTFELLERMDGNELKKFFYEGYQEVVQSWQNTLDDMSPEISQGLQQSMRELKALEDYKTFVFQHLDEVTRTHLRHRFENHRLVEVQRAFERLITARSATERRVALETVVLVFHLADEAAEKASAEKQKAKEAENVATDATESEASVE